MQQLQGKNVLVTGASRGVGQVIARTFARAGANLVLVARSQGALEQLAAELEATGVRVVALVADLGDFAGHDELVDRATHALGSLDILVNNAALEENAFFGDYARGKIEELVRVDLLAPMLLTRSLLPQLLAQQTGHIVNIASVAGKNGAAYNATYAAAKAGLIVFSQSLRAELKGSGVGISCVSPGFISDVGMYANKASASNARAPRAAGVSSPQLVADSVLRAIRENRAEIVVSPGPIRLLSALNQIVPDWISNLIEWLGVTAVFRESAKADTDARVIQALQDAQRSGLSIEA
jgi:short-subunit dehydrogenase